MKKEMTKVLEMVRDGKLEVDKAKELIDLLNTDEQAEESHVSSIRYDERMLKINILSSDGDHVTINLPVKFVKGVLRAGRKISGSFHLSSKYADEIDTAQILEAIENETVGKILEIRSSSGDNISISIE